tara:strand:- start:10386 stop:11177 length:792 start_codon:yes stop_codon:yes gene_type:complete
MEKQKINLKLTTVIVSYNRLDYTKKCIESFRRVKPEGSIIVVIDNGSTDGTREYLQEEQEKNDDFGYIFPEENIYVGGAWELAANTLDDSEYVLLLDNDAFFREKDKNWFDVCKSFFESMPSLGSIGMYDVPKPGTYSNGIVDEGYKNRKELNGVEYFDTIHYAGYRIDRWDVFKKLFKNWNSKWIAEGPNVEMRKIGYNSIRLVPGFVHDQSEFDMDNPKYEEYYTEFWGKEHKNNMNEFERRKVKSSNFKKNNKVEEFLNG